MAPVGAALDRAGVESREKTTNINFWFENLQETIMCSTNGRQDKIKMDLRNCK
jgi:hypothetical protein